MRSVCLMVAAGAALLTGLPAARAADLPSLPPPAIQMPVEELGGWYLRGDIGMSNQQVGELHNALYDSNPYTAVSRDFDSAPFFGIGIGYQFNSWLRADLTGEYRGGASFHGLDTYPGGDDIYNARKSEWTVLGNVYADLGTWYSITPFVGAGIGFSYNTISDFVDINNATGTTAYGATASKFSLAWALHAGLAYKVTPNFTVELAYRYLDLGKAESGDLITTAGFNGIYNPMEFRDLTSHDIKLGIRWSIQPEPMPQPMMPLMRKG